MENFYTYVLAKNMKRIFAFALLVLFLLNVLGYYGVFIGLQMANTREMVKKLDADDYQESEAQTFKIPLAVPYYADSRDFERVDGEFEHNGEVFRLVKQRLHKDTLYIVCVKDVQSKKINQVLEDYVKTFTDKPVNGKENARTGQQLIKDFISFHIEVYNTALGWNLPLSYKRLLLYTIACAALPVVQPPRTSLIS
jgi:hypothetical protein